MNNITIAGYKFVVADNTICLPSAANTQNEMPESATAACEEESEDAILIASGLLPRLVVRARMERLRG